MKKEQYPTDVAEILDIPKEKYDEVKDDDKDFKKLKHISDGKIAMKAIEDEKANQKEKQKPEQEKSKELSRQKLKMKQG